MNLTLEFFFLTTFRENYFVDIVSFNVQPIIMIKYFKAFVQFSITDSHYGVKFHIRTSYFKLGRHVLYHDVLFHSRKPYIIL